MKPIFPKFLGAALLAAASLSPAAEIDVMTQNQYLGADLAPVLGAATAVPFDPAAFSAAVVDALRKIAATRPAERARALAHEIAERKPDVVGLQEAYAFACLPYPGVPNVAGRGCDDESIRAAFSDHLQDTVAALRGHWVIAGKVTNLKVDAIPFAIDGFPALLAVADRDAILVRLGLSAGWVDFTTYGACAKPSDQGCNFLTAPPPFATPVGSIAVERGFLAVDVTVKDRAYRVFNTHLEQRLLAPNLPETRLLQVGQAWELLGTALGTWDGVKKVIVVGDFNSDPADTIPVPPYPATLPWAPTLPVVPPYAVFTSSGFTDTWTLRPHDSPGLTCCQAEDLMNRQPALYERIDMIFSLSWPSHVLDMKLLGNTMGDKTRPPGHGGLWPSDHAALAAKLKFD
jgi:endonuclease/exonuclease/phosphatase family metal-dependent hydrolase